MNLSDDKTLLSSVQQFQEFIFEKNFDLHSLLPAVTVTVFTAKNDLNVCKLTFYAYYVFYIQYSPYHQHILPVSLVPQVNNTVTMHNTYCNNQHY